MALKEFIFQGFTERTHKDTVRGLFDVDGIKSALISVAFVNEAGVEQLIDKLTAHGKNLTVFAGIRNDITTYQAMVKLQSIPGITLYAVDTGARHIVFHPKIYLAKGEKEAHLSIGSANLTLGGLNNNVEAGMLIKFDLTNPDDVKTIADMEAQFLQLPKAHPENITLIKTTADLDNLLKLGRLVDETEAAPPRPARSGGKSDSEADKVPRIKLGPAYIRPPVRKASKPKPKPAPKASATPGAAVAPVPVSNSVGLQLVWQSKPLLPRDITTPAKDQVKASAKGIGTNPTGSINLDKGLLPAEVDHRHYFRDDVFPALTWTRSTDTVDETHARFQLVIKNLDYGEHTLRIGHTHDTNSTSYKQRNAMTRLSWGPMQQYVKGNESLIGRTMSLYRDEADPTRFVIEID